jgi:hypothetical protein
MTNADSAIGVFHHSIEQVCKMKLDSADQALDLDAAAVTSAVERNHSNGKTIELGRGDDPARGRRSFQPDASHRRQSQGILGIHPP